MLSLPLIYPHETDSAWRGSSQPRADSPPPVNGQTPHQTHRQRQLREGEKKQQHARSPLAILAAEEAAIRQRKAAVRGFGAQWIRPIGFPKTLQAQTEEEVERLEQLEEQRRNQGLDDLQAQQQLLETQQQAQEHAAQEEAGDDEGDEEEEVDLDAEIPDADATGLDLTFNEDSMMEGSQADQAEQNADEYAEMEEAELTGAARDEEDLDMDLDRDLDDSVPEAGSYQHTDTELEDTESESELQEDSFTNRSAARSARMPTPLPRPSLDAQAMGGLQARMRAQVGAADSLPRSPGSLNLSSSILESSMIGSSPVIQRTNAASRGRPRRGRHS